MKRFYKAVTTAEHENGWRVLLDGRGIKTPSGTAQIVPTQVLAQAMAAEWAAQAEEIDAAAFPLRDLADYAIEVVPAERDALANEIAAYAGTDTLCYRADPDEPLYRRQHEVWEPLLEQAEARWNVRFERVSGVMHRPQPDQTLARMREAVKAQSDWSIAALNMLTSLSASLVVALLALEPDADADALWTAANLEEDWQVEQWGSDPDAQARRRARFEAFALAMRFAAMARDG